jgi:TonB C terminal
VTLTREAWVFQRALLASLLLHALLLTLFFTLPGGGAPEPVQIYTVRIMEAPAQPEARALELSTEAISALKLESPSLRADAPPLPAPEQPDVPDVERFAQPSAAAAPALPRAPAAPPAPPPSPTAPLTAAPQAPPSLPSLPSLPAAAPAAAPAARPPAAAARKAGPPTALPDAEPERPSAMEQLRSKVRTLNLQVEAAPRPAPSDVPAPARERNVLSLRLYSNRVREAVKEQYTFPGAFDAGLRARVRVVLERDGTLRSTELLESSGNERFDRLVCLAAFNKARIPAVPPSVEGDGDTLTLYFTCSP